MTLADAKRPRMELLSVRFFMVDFSRYAYRLRGSSAGARRARTVLSQPICRERRSDVPAGRNVVRASLDFVASARVRGVG
jgi:hypothetical protein